MDFYRHMVIKCHIDLKRMKQISWAIGEMMMLYVDITVHCTCSCFISMKLEFRESIIFIPLNLHYFLIYCNGWFFLSSVQQLIVQKKKTWVMWVGLLQWHNTFARYLWSWHICCSAICHQHHPHVQIGLLLHWFFEYLVDLLAFI